MDLRKGDLDSATKRLQALKAADLSPQFKNDWVARHFAKTLNVAGVEAKLGNGTKVIEILHANDQDLLVIGTEANELKIWAIDAESGITTLLPAEMPPIGNLSQATLSADGNWLAMGLDNVSAEGRMGEPIWLIHLETGKRVGIPEQANANQHVLGCRGLGFVNDEASPNEFQLITVEELSAYRGLKERLQIVTRNIAVKGLEEQGLSVSEKSVKPIEATTRDDRRVQYGVTMNLRLAKPIIAAVYSALDSDGSEILVLETLVANEGASQFAAVDNQLNLSQQKVAISQVPTSLHLSSTGKLYCGHADGRIDLYELSQLTEKPTLTASEHESTVTVLSSSANGTIISGGANGLLVVLDQELKSIKRLVGQTDPLTAISIADSKSDDQPGELGDDSGFQLASGGANGHVRVWLPESTTHDAAIRKQESDSGNEAELRLGGNRTVTCGAVDRNWMATEVPATAYGTSDGQVYYFSPDSMRARGAFQKIPTDASNTTSLSIPPPPGSFDTTFDNFDSFGIVENQFVLLQTDGQLFSALINPDSTEPSSQIGLHADAVKGFKMEGQFIPRMASVKDRPIFFTNNPVDGRQILAWCKTSESGTFKSTVAHANSTATGRIKRLRFSSDGRWLAVIREAEQTNTTGEYVIEILSVGSEFGPDMLQSVTVTGRFRVGDPAFVSFSSDSRKLIFHFHKLGVDRETWIETWSLAGNQWTATDRKRRVDESPVDLMAWDGAEKLITRINKQFYVNLPDGGGLLRAQEYRPQFSEEDRQRLRSVQPAKVAGDQYVLFDQSLGLFDDQGGRRKRPKIDLSNARDIQVFGNQAIVLDDYGFHLIDDDLNYVTLIARRKIATTAISLSQGRLAVSYDVGGLCRILDVSGEVATEIGRIAGVQQIRLSPDGKWAACQRDSELQIYSIESKFEEPILVQPVMAKNWSVEWIGTTSPQLLVAIQKDEAFQLEWKSIDPRTGETAAPSIRLPQELEGGQLTEFELAQHSQKYLALIKQQKGKKELELWAVSATADPVLLSSEPRFMAYDVNPITVAFSEIDLENKSEIGTRMIVLNRESDADDDSLTASSRIFLLADEQIADRAGAKAEAGSEAIKTIHRVFEIEGVIDVTDGRQLLDAAFSGDGRSLLEVDNRGLKLLLSKDW
jgi:WD40 repeat protein